MVTLEEAQEIASILATADGGCTVCFENLTDAMQQKFPEFDWYELGRDKEEEDTEPKFGEFIKGTFGTSITYTMSKIK